MPQSVAVALLGGELGLRQLPREAERKAALSDAVAFKAGSDGATLANARRAWVAYMQYASARGLPDSGLPASAAFVASFLHAERLRAASGTGTQGGTTVANSRRVGLLWHAEKLNPSTSLI